MEIWVDGVTSAKLQRCMKEEEHGEEEELTKVMASAVVQYQAHSEEEDFSEPKQYTVGEEEKRRH
jgi:hypothetical protein